MSSAKDGLSSSSLSSKPQGYRYIRNCLQLYRCTFASCPELGAIISAGGSDSDNLLPGNYPKSRFWYARKIADLLAPTTIHEIDQYIATIAKKRLAANPSMQQAQSQAQPPLSRREMAAKTIQQNFRGLLIKENSPTHKAPSTQQKFLWDKYN